MGNATGQRIAAVQTVALLRDAVHVWRSEGCSVGLVPTMGALHEGHLALVRRALDMCDRVVVSIFVNPAQFGPTEDFTTYPRREAEDAAKLNAVGAHLLFAPDVAEMYPQGFTTTVSVGGSLTQGLCAPHRPGHFDGVATVVSKLLLQCLPDAAFFGEKDWQQLQVIRRMSRDLDIPARIEGVPTVREADGLALSSRNAYLTPEQRARAVAFPQALHAAAARIAADGAVEPALTAAREHILAAGFSKIDYVELAEAETLLSARDLVRPARIFGAAWLDSTRLIDNMAVGASLST